MNVFIWSHPAEDVSLQSKPEGQMSWWKGHSSGLPVDCTMRWASFTFASFLVLFASPVHGDRFKSTHCRQLLDRNYVDSATEWHLRSCQLIRYGEAEFAHCLDNMSTVRKRKLHFVFIGDSRIRQQFYSFLEVIPDFDAEWDGAPRRMKLQADMDVDSRLLNTRVSFRWRTLINQTVVSEFIEWSTLPSEDTPTLIMAGISAHHMLQVNGADQRIFENMLKRIEPRIRKISDRCKVIWMNQQPLVENHQVNKESLVHSDKLERYNQAARRILKESGAIFWDSGNPSAEEYLRSCAVHPRSDVTWYHHCTDFIHTGYVALSRSMQMFLNYLCNEFVAVDFLHVGDEICCLSLE